MSQRGQPNQISDGLHYTDILTDSVVPEYEQAMDFFHVELLKLNVNIYVAERVLEFPIGALTEHIADQTIFLGQLVDNFLDASLLIITKLATDSGSDTYTLIHLKNQLSSMTRPEYQASVRARLRVARVSTTISRLFDRAKKLRNNRVAHFNREYVLGRMGSELLGAVSEVKTLRDTLKGILDALSFGVERVTLPQGYEDGYADVDQFLDAYARCSDVLNMPERNPEYWRHIRSRLTEDDIAHINRYRAKFGLLPA